MSEEATGFAGLVEADEREDVPIDRSHLVWRRCACGSRALAAAEYHGEALCSNCRQGRTGAGAGVTELLGKYGPVHGSRAGVDRRPPVERDPFPAPAVTSRDPWDGEGVPNAAAKLAQRARKAGWEVKVQRSTGCFPNAANGAPSAPRELFGLIFRHGTRNAYAIRDGDSWSSVMMWGADVPWFPLGSVTDLEGYLLAAGDMPAGWYDEIRGRGAAKERRKRERQGCDRGVHLYTQDSAVPGPLPRFWCELCTKRWRVAGEPWKKPKVGKTEAL